MLRTSRPLGALEDHEAQFFGDAPRTPRYAVFNAAPAEAGLSAWRLRYQTRDLIAPSETVSGLVYGPDGLARLNGAVDLGLSSGGAFGMSAVGRMLMARPAEVLPQGTIIERDFPNTYGDYCSEDHKVLVLSDDVLEPVIFPKSFETRDYLHRDMTRLGLSYCFADRVLRIETARVLRKANPFSYWSAAEVQAYRARLGVVDCPPRPGSVLYLSRQNVVSHRVGGSGPIDTRHVAKVVRSLGGQVVDTEGLYFEDFQRLAGEAETVIADHGAAMFNALLWRPRQVIELVPDDWWSPCFVVLSQHLGVERHITLNVESRPDLEAALRRFTRH